MVHTALRKLLAPAPRLAATPWPGRNTVFHRGPDGRLVLDAGTERRMHELAASVPADASLGDLERMEAMARQGLPGPLAVEAVCLMHNYLAYRRTQAAARCPDARQRAEARRKFLGAEAALALFPATELAAHPPGDMQ
jgi:hypothetical protein